MSDEPTVDEIKERLKVEIPMEEEEILKVEVEEESASIVDELGNMGKKFAETLQTAWDSEERNRFESEVREGLKSFADEVDKVMRNVRAGNVMPSGETTEKIKTEAEQVRTRIETKIDVDEIAGKARSGLVTGLRWFSDELGKLADQFTTSESAVEKAPEDIDDAA